VGLPLAREACFAGESVVGFDEQRVHVVRGSMAGESHIREIPGVDIEKLVRSSFRATVDPNDLRGCRIVVICVATPLDGRGVLDLSQIRRIAGTITARLRPGMMIVLASTTYPGTTEQVLRPILEQSSGLVAGVDFHLALLQELIDTGNQKFGLRKTPKVVGGLTPACAHAAREFQETVCDTVVVARSGREAEMSKLVEKIYRNVNIALVNELAMVAHALEVGPWDAIRCAATKPFGIQPFCPEPGTGGHCIPSNPVYLTSRARDVGMRPGSSNLSVRSRPHARLRRCQGGRWTVGPSMPCRT